MAQGINMQPLTTKELVAANTLTTAEGSREGKSLVSVSAAFNVAEWVVGILTLGIGAIPFECYKLFHENQAIRLSNEVVALKDRLLMFPKGQNFDALITLHGQNITLHQDQANKLTATFEDGRRIDMPFGARQLAKKLSKDIVSHLGFYEKSAVLQIIALRVPPKINSNIRELYHATLVGMCGDDLGSIATVPTEFLGDLARSMVNGEIRNPERLKNQINSISKSDNINSADCLELLYGLEKTMKEKPQKVNSAVVLRNMDYANREIDKQDLKITQLRSFVADIICDSDSWNHDNAEKPGKRLYYTLTRHIKTLQMIDNNRGLIDKAGFPKALEDALKDVFNLVVVRGVFLLGEIGVKALLNSDIVNEKLAVAEKEIDAALLGMVPDVEAKMTKAINALFSVEEQVDNVRVNPEYHEYIELAKTQDPLGTMSDFLVGTDGSINFKPVKHNGGDYIDLKRVGNELTYLKSPPGYLIDFNQVRGMEEEEDDVADLVDFKRIDYLSDFKFGQNHNNDIFIGSKNYDDDIIISNKNYDDDIIISNKSHDNDIIISNKSHDNDIIISNKSHNNDIFISNKNYDDDGIDLMRKKDHGNRGRDFTDIRFQKHRDRIDAMGEKEDDEAGLIEFNRSRDISDFTFAQYHDNDIFNDNVGLKSENLLLTDAEIVDKMMQGRVKLDEMLGTVATDLRGAGYGKFMKETMLTYFSQQDAIDKRAMIAASIRHSAANASEGALLGAMLKGAGPIMQKMLQGFSTADMDPIFQEALRDMKANLAPIHEHIVKAQIYRMVKASKGSITKIEVVKSLGAASVGEAFLCKVTTPQRQEPVDCVIKLLRPDVQARADRERKIFEKVANDIPGMGVTFAGQLQRILDELDLKKEEKNIKLSSIYENGAFTNVHTIKVLPLIDPTASYIALEKAPGVTLDAYYRDGKVKLEELIAESNNKPATQAFVNANIIMDMYVSLEDLQSALKNAAMTWVSEGIFVSGFYHGDLHAGNMMFDKNHGLSLIDYGNATSLTPTEQSGVTVMMAAAVSGNTQHFLAGFDTLLSPSGRTAFNNKKNALAAELDNIIKLGGIEDAGKRITLCLATAAKMGIELPASIFNFSQCQMRLQGTMESMNAYAEDLIKGLRTIISQMNLAEGLEVFRAPLVKSPFTYSHLEQWFNEGGFYDCLRGCRKTQLFYPELLPYEKDVIALGDLVRRIGEAIHGDVIFSDAMGKVLQLNFCKTAFRIGVSGATSLLKKEKEEEHIGELQEKLLAQKKQVEIDKEWEDGLAKTEQINAQIKEQQEKGKQEK